ncbi:hypothetical protein WEI85_11270 [Actinomycetes bacterium KLBMP 9797]
MRYAIPRVALAALAGALAIAVVTAVGAAGVGRSAFAAVTATPTGLTTSTPLPSPSTVPAARQWTPASCATGQFTGFTTEANGQLTLLGDATLCGGYRDKFAFTLVVFKPSQVTAFAYSSALLEYEPEGATPFQAVMRVPPPSGEVGVCVMRGPTAAMACVRLTFAVGEPAVLEPIPVTDPLVRKPVLFVLDTPRSPDPECGACVRLIP